MFDYRSDVDQKLINRREVVFIVLVGLFLGTLAMLNILGISRSIQFTIILAGNSCDAFYRYSSLPHNVFMHRFH